MDTFKLKNSVKIRIVSLLPNGGRKYVRTADGGYPYGCPLVAARLSVRIRTAAKILGTFDLSGCEIYTSCEPCPMCLGAIYWAHLDRMYYGNSKKDAADIGFDDAFIYEELDLKPADRKLKSEVLLPEEAIKAFRDWENKTDKVEY